MSSDKISRINRKKSTTYSHTISNSNMELLSKHPKPKPRSSFGLIKINPKTLENIVNPPRKYHSLGNITKYPQTGLTIPSSSNTTPRVSLTPSDVFSDSLSVRLYTFPWRRRSTVSHIQPRWAFRRFR